MSRRALVAAVLAVLTALAGGLPGRVAPAAAASCSSWSSETDPPPAIRVFRHATGAVDAVDFRAYTANVLSREWIGSWTTESLRSGALAVKSYAWYQVLHWRGGVNADGACFDLRDDTYDQVYDPSKATWTSAAAAVDATWATRVLKSGAIFPTYYNAGTTNEACGANANGWKLWQWGTQGCGLAGMTAAEMMVVYYYPGVTVTDATGSGPDPDPGADGHADARADRPADADRDSDRLLWHAGSDRCADRDPAADADRHPITYRDAGSDSTSSTAGPSAVGRPASRGPSPRPHPRRLIRRGWS